MAAIFLTAQKDMPMCQFPEPVNVSLFSKGVFADVNN